MEKKNFSGIVEILRTNGICFLECMFRSSLCMDDEVDKEGNEGKPWRIDFSDGKEYLGSLDTTVGSYDIQGYGRREEKDVYPQIVSIRLCLSGEQYGCPSFISIELGFADHFIQGKCEIWCETPDLTW